MGYAIYRDKKLGNYQLDGTCSINGVPHVRIVIECDPSTREFFPRDVLPKAEHERNRLVRIAEKPFPRAQQVNA